MKYCLKRKSIWTYKIALYARLNIIKYRTAERWLLAKHAFNLLKLLIQLT